MTISKESYQYKYDIEGTAIDINTLLLSQLHFVSLFNEVQKELFPAFDVKIKVEAPSAGSYVFNQIFEYVVKNNIFVTENAILVQPVMEGIKQLIELKKWLKGEKADNVVRDSENVTITKGDDNRKYTFAIFNIYRNNVVVNNAIEKQAQVLENDDAINGISISQKDNLDRIIELTKPEFSELDNPNQYLDGVSQEDIKKGIRLFVKKADVIPQKTDAVSWVFLYDGVQTISAKITDPNFIKRVNDGLRVGKGDYLVADVKIISKFDEGYMTYIPYKYEVIHVLRFEERQNPQQGHIQFGENLK